MNNLLINCETSSFNTYQIEIQNNSWRVNANDQQEAFDSLLNYLNNIDRFDSLFVDGEDVDELIACNSDGSLVLACSWEEVEIVNTDYLADSALVVN